MRFPNATVAPFLNNVEVNITDNCNLNCKACNHFSPFVKGRLKNSAERFEKDLTKLLSVYKINKLVLLGGEPLLEPELLKQFVEISRKFRDRYEMLIIITNGLLIPSLKDGFLQFLKENQVHVSVTLYPPTLALKQEIEDVLRKHGIWYFISRPVHEFMKRLSFTPTDKPQFNSDICLSNGCYHLRDGYIYKCPDSFTIKYMDAAAGTDFASKGDAIPLDFVIANPVATMDELHSSIELCRFCGDTFLESIPWERVDGKPDIKSWFVD